MIGIVQEKMDKNSIIKVIIEEKRRNKVDGGKSYGTYNNSGKF